MEIFRFQLIWWGGQKVIAERLISGYDPKIEAQNLSLLETKCGGEIDVACITKDKQLQWLKQKNLIVK